MSRLVLTRAIFAPVAIAIAITVVPPGHFSDIETWLTETLPATAASVSWQIGEKFSQAGEDARHASKRLAGSLLQATAVISSDTNFTLSRLDELVAVALPTTAPVDAPTDALPLLPSAADEPSQPENKRLLAEAAPEPAAAAIAAPVPLPLPRPPQASRKTQVEESLPAQPSVPELAVVVPEPELPRPSAQPARPEVKIAAAEVAVQPPVVSAVVVQQPIVSMAHEVTIEIPAPIVELPPPAELKTAREIKADEKQVFASLALPASVSDARAVRPDPLEIEAMIAQEYKPASVEAEDRHIDSHSPASPSQASNMPTAPLKIRPLTRADMPPPERFASLGSRATQSNIAGNTASSLSGIVPPEQQRVAYDAQPISEQPTSIGKRRTVDDTKYTGLGSPEALLEALRHMGSNAKSLGLPASLWCADFMNLVLRKSGLNATGSRAAKSYLQYGKKIDEPRVGAIAIFERGKNGGHIGIVRGTDGSGNPIIVSGNHNNKVAEAVYPKSRVIAYVVPRESAH